MQFNVFSLQQRCIEYTLGINNIVEQNSIL